jgi:hypothetical protein
MSSTEPTEPVTPEPDEPADTNPEDGTPDEEPVEDDKT